MELENVLRQEVPHLRPETGPEVLARAGEGERAPVVDERVDPDVDNLIRVPRNRYAPVLRGPADADVVEPAFDEAARLVVPEAGEHDLRPLVVEAKKRLLVRREPEEVVLLLDELRPDPVLRAQSVDELVLGVEGLAARAVEPGVHALEDVAAVVDPLQELLHTRLVPLVRRADEEVVRRVHAHGHLLERGGVSVDELLQVQPLLLRDPRDVRAVLVRPGQEEGLLAPLTQVTHEDVRCDRRVRVADVRGRVDVVDGRRDVEAHRRPSYGRVFGARSAVSSRRRRELK